MENNTKTILVIEDDLGLNQLICEKIEDMGYNTKCTLSVSDAIEWLSVNEPFMMVLDYSLADKTATEFIDNIVTKGFELAPFLIVTGNGDERIAVEMMKLGARDYIIKDTNLLPLLPSVINRIAAEINNENKLKLAEDALVQSEEKFRFLFTENPQPMFIYNIQTLEILEVNHTALNFYGYTKEECTSMTIKDLHPAEDMDSFIKKVEETRLGKNTNGLSKHIKKNGELIFVEIYSVSAKSWGEHARLSLVVDITERKMIENTNTFLLTCGITNPNENFFESLAQYLSQTFEMEYVCIDSLEGDGLTATTLAIYNDGVFDTNVSYTLKETPCGQVLEKSICCFTENVCDLFPNDAALRDLNAESYVGTTLWNFNGKPIGLIAIIGRKPLVNTDMVNKILRLVSIKASAELERKNAEEALRESEQMFADMAYNSAGVIYQFYARPNGESGFYYLSPKVKEMFNFSDNLASADWKLGENVHPDDKEIFINAVQTAIIEQKKLDVEVRICTSMGTKWIHFLSVPMKKNNEIVFNGIMIDVTNRKELSIAIQDNESKMKKLLLSSSILIDSKTEETDYQKITDTIAEISGAKYVSFDVVNNLENKIQTYALSGIKENILKITSLLGFEIINKRWNIDPIKAAIIEKKIVTRFKYLSEITRSQIPETISNIIEKTFNLGEVVIVRIAQKGITIGFFTLFFTNGNTLKNTDLIELYANQIGLFIERKKAEDTLIKKNADLDYMNKFMVNREVRMAEMKQEVNELLQKLGKEKRYL